MSDHEEQGREALAEILYEADRARHEPPWGDALDHHRKPFRHMARIALASEWLKAHDAEVAAAALLEAADALDVFPEHASTRRWLRARADEGNPR